MDKHSFKIIYSNEDDVYRILDLTDTSIVGVTEMYETDMDREGRVFLHNEIKTKQRIGAKVVGYGIFILLDKDNMPTTPQGGDDYLRSILRQMAFYFKETEIDKNPDFFKEYYIPKPKRNTTVSDDRPILKSPEITVSQTISNPLGEKQNKEKKKLEAGDIITYVMIGIVGLVALAIAVGIVWLIVHLFQYGVIGAIIFILCTLAFIPELFR